MASLSLSTTRCPAFGMGGPLPRRCLQPEVSIGGNTGTVLDDRDTRLMSIGIDVIEDH